MLSQLNKGSRWLYDFGPLLLWMGLIFWLSSQSTLVDIESQIWERVIYKSAHMAAYAALAWLWWRALAPQRHVTWPVLFGALLLTILYGISDEIHQRLVPGRHGRVADVLFDAGGALAMVLLIRWVSRLRSV
jgi:VanZ family protein